MKPCLLHDNKQLKDGYVLVRVGGRKKELAHRLAYCEANCVDLAAIYGQVVRHLCDVRNCVEPEHLAIGTQVENMADRKRNDGTYFKLSESKIEGIRAALREGLTQRAIAAEYGVSQPIVSRIKTGEIWQPS